MSFLDPFDRGEKTALLPGVATAIEIGLWTGTNPKVQDALALMMILTLAPVLVGVLAHHRKRLRLRGPSLLLGTFAASATGLALPLPVWTSADLPSAIFGGILAVGGLIGLEYVASWILSMICRGLYRGIAFPLASGIARMRTAWRGSATTL